MAVKEKYKLELVVREDDSVRVKVANPGNLSAWSIIGLLEKIKVELILNTEEPETKTEEGE